MLATVLFTDIVGSTDRAATSAMLVESTLLDRHDLTMRREIERYRGA